MKFENFNECIERMYRIFLKYKYIMRIRGGHGVQ